MDAREQIYYQQLGYLNALLTAEEQLKEQIAFRREIVSQLQAVLGIEVKPIPQPAQALKKKKKHRDRDDDDGYSYPSSGNMGGWGGGGDFGGGGFSGGGGDFGGGGASGSW